MQKSNSGWKEKIESLKLIGSWTYKSSRFLTISTLITTIIAGLLTIVEPYIFKLVIDHLVNLSNLQIAAQISAALILILVFYGIARIIQNLSWDITNSIRRIHAQRIERHVMYEMMKNISSLDLVYFENPKYYNILSRATQNLWRVSEAFWQGTFFISEFLSSAVIIGALILFDWRIVLLIIIGAIPSIVLALKWAEALWGAFVESSPIARHAYYYRSLLTEQPEAIREIKTFNLQNYFLKKFSSLFDDFLRKQDKAALNQLKWYLIIAVIEGSTSLIAAYLVINSYLKGNASIGDVTFLWAILFQFASHVRWVVRMIGDMNTHATFLTPVVEVLKFKPTIIEPLKPKEFPKMIKQGIEFRDLTFYYPNSKKPALKDVNLFIKPDESIALVGENGSGKTTFIKLLCRLYDPTKGEIFIDGTNIKEFSLKDLYNNIGTIFQDFMKYEALVEENIRFGRIETTNNKKEVHEAAIKSGAWEFIKELDKEYKTHIGKKLKDEGMELSIGQWQKVALARAFFRNAQILVLDEPTSAVDAKTEYKLFQKFKQFTKNKITLLISHRFSTVRMADKIVVLDKGKIIEFGSHKLLLRKNGTYSKLFNLQAQGYR